MNKEQGGDARRVLFGDPREWEQFERRNPQFVSRIRTLVRTIKIAFKPLTVSEPVDKILFHLVRLCVEDFSEILLLCGNGYGIGAEKLLRGMYERAVTATYLHHHPEEADNFLAYHKIADHRLMNAVIATPSDPFSPEQKRKIEDDFRQVKPRFMIPDCKKCGTQRLNHTWTALDFVTMAKNSGGLGKLLVPAYYMGMREGHSTVGAIFSRLDADAAGTDEGLVFDGGSQPERADTALLTAHKIVLIVLELHKDHFQLKALEEPLQTCISDLLAIWDKSGDKENSQRT